MTNLDRSDIDALALAADEVITAWGDDGSADGSVLLPQSWWDRMADAIIRLDSVKAIAKRRRRG